MGEKVEVVAYRCGNSGRHWNLRKMLPKGWIFSEPLMTVAQHERIVAGLEARLLESRGLLIDARFDMHAFPSHVKDRIDAFLAQTAEGS